MISEVLGQAAAGTIKVFVLAGDESVLEQGAVDDRTDGVHEDFYPHPVPTAGENRKHVMADVYAVPYAPGMDLAALTPVATAEVEIGGQRMRRADPKSRGRVPVPMATFPEKAFLDGHATVLRGYVSVKTSGRYELLPGEGDSAFNATTLEGQEVYRQDVDKQKPQVTPVALESGKRYAFQTVFFKKPGHAFRLPQVDRPGTLETVARQNPAYAFLKDAEGNWARRDDAVIYDAHPIHNNTEAPARPLGGVVKTDGPEGGWRMGIDMMLGHRLGDAFDDPVMIIRFANRHPIWFMRGSLDLSHGFRPPSSGGDPDLAGSWDVIHFNFGVWDAGFKDASSKYFSGYNITSVEDFEKNLRTLVAKMKKTGATIIWGSVTPVWEGETGRLNADEDAFNEVAAKVMQENGVIINDLNAEVRRQGFPKSDDVHSVGNLAPKVTATILAALEAREKKTKPLPRVLMIGDSITGSYQEQVTRDLDGKAYVCKNPGNAEDTWNGLERMDEWLDLKRYLQNGQAYLELVDGVKKIMGEKLARAYPGYAGQQAELAGFVWFQGIADAGSDVKSAEYEANLANLIRDLRRDFGVPQLPFVVGALADSGGMANPRGQRIFAAQMAVGDPAKYPEFAGNVVSIDTRPMCRPQAEWPGGRDNYKGNAAAYLEIGDTMARAMLNLLGKE